MKNTKQNSCLSAILFLLVSFFTVFIFNGCRKTDTITNNQDVKQIEEKFLTLPANSSPELQSVANELKKQNEKYHFIPDFVKKNGYPVWEKVLWNNNSSQNRSVNQRSNNNNDTLLFFIPLQQSVGASINSYITCLQPDSNDCIFRYYNKTAIEAVQHVDSAQKEFLENALSIVGYFNKQINNKDTLHVGGIFNEAIYNVAVNFGDGKMGGKNFKASDYWVGVEICVEHILVCPVFYKSSGINDLDCYTTWYYFWRGGSGSGGGGGNTDQQWWYLDGSGGGGGGGGPVIYNQAWFNLQPNYTINLSGLDAYPCAQTIVNEVIGLSNSTIQTIQSIFSQSTKFNINFIVDPNLNVPGNTSEIPSYYKIDGTFGELAYLNITIKLNPEHIVNATKLSIAHTIIHEMIHAYFYYRSIEAFGDPVKEQNLANELGFLKPYDPNALVSTYGNQHEQMAATFVSNIATSLKEYKLISNTDLAAIQNRYPSLDIDTYYKAMAWGGLTGDKNGYVTKAWEDFETKNPSIAEMYKLIITAELYATDLAASQEKCH